MNGNDSDPTPEIERTRRRNMERNAGVFRQLFA